MTWPLTLQKRALPAQHWQWLAPLLALVLTLITEAVIFLALGKDPLASLQMFWLEPLRSARGWSEVALKMAPLLLCGVGLVWCFRANVWNIGAEGQLLLGALGAGGMALWLDSLGWRGLPVHLLTLLAGALAGALWAALTAWLRDYCHTNEILVSLMLVYIAQLLLSYLVHGPWKDPNGFNFPQSKLFAASALAPLWSPYRLHWGFVFGLVAVAVSAWLLSRSLLGLRVRVGGLAPRAASYAGYSARAALWGVLLLCGALAGLAGATEVLGPIGQLNPHVSPGYGFAAIIVAFVARLQPLGVLPASFVLALFYIGGELAQSRLGLPSALTNIFQGLLLFYLLACDSLVTYRLRWRKPATTS